MRIDMRIVNKYEQIGEYSCIPSAVELVLKPLEKVHQDYYEQQKKGNACT